MPSSSDTTQSTIPAFSPSVESGAEPCRADNENGRRYYRSTFGTRAGSSVATDILARVLRKDSLANISMVANRFCLPDFDRIDLSPAKAYARSQTEGAISGSCQRVEPGAEMPTDTASDQTQYG